LLTGIYQELQEIPAGSWCFGRPDGRPAGKQGRGTSCRIPDATKNVPNGMGYGLVVVPNDER